MFTNKDLGKLIIPLVFEQLLAVLVGMADSLMVSRVGEAAVSGVSLVDSINILLIGLFSALATGGAVVTAMYIGQKKNDRASRSAEQLLLIVSIISIIVMAIAIIGNSFILKIMFGKVEFDVMAFAKTYFFITALSFPFLALYNGCAALFRSMGNSKLSLYISIVMNLINIIGNIILIYVFKLGVAGAAISTLVSRIVAAVAIYILLRKSKDEIKINNILQYRFDKNIIRRILRIGIPNGLENSVFQIGKILVQGIVASFGTAAITANAVANTISGFSVLPGSAISLALITVVGQSMGSHDFDGVKKYTVKLLKITHISMAFINVIIIFLLPFIQRIYNLSFETTEITNQLIIFYCIVSPLLWPSAFALPNAIRATNDVNFTMIVSIASMWTFRIGFSYILAKGFDMGVIGVWIAMVIDWICRSTCFVTRFLKGKYREL